MNVVCPKCAYQRASTDTAPDWQCPSCGIAYAKYVKPEPVVRPARLLREDPPRIDDSADEPDTINATAKKLLAMMAFVAAFAAVRYGLAAIREKTAPAKPSQIVEQPKVDREEKDDVAEERPRPAAAEPQVPVDTLKDLFVAAHDQGEANGLMIVEAGSTGLAHRVNITKPVKVRVDRESPLLQSGCDRFKVTLTQGGSTDYLPGGRQAKSAISTLLVYSLNYCIDGDVPNDGHAIEIVR